MGGTIARLQQAAKAIDDAGTGYDQSQRWTFYQNRKIVPNKECDCSTFVGAAVQMAGYDIDLAGTFYTGNLKERLQAAGFTAISFSSLSQVRDGDILIKPGYHTELAYTSKRFISAHVDERGKITGGAAGEQNGREVGFSNAYNYSPGGWTWILRPPNELPQKPPVTPPAANSWTVTTRAATKWRSGAGTNYPVIKSYGKGAKIEVVGKVTGQDPYKDGRNKWYKSKVSGLYCWEGTVE